MRLYCAVLQFYKSINEKTNVHSISNWNHKIKLFLKLESLKSIKGMDIYIKYSLERINSTEQQDYLTTIYNIQWDESENKEIGV